MQWGSGLSSVWSGRRTYFMAGRRGEHHLGALNEMQLFLHD
jgi:hypothetical protein